jgi:predicted MFS family arabinose efflux permease
MSTAKRRFTLAIIALVMVVLNSDTNVMTPTLANIEAEFGVNDSSIGVMMGLFTIIGAVVSLLWGYFADKASRKLLFLLAVVVGELPCMLTAFAPSYPVFFGLRILSGIGLGAAFPLVFAIIGDTFDEKGRPIATVVISVAIAVGNIAGTLIGGYLGSGGNWRLPFVVASAPNFIFILLFMLFAPEAKKAASEEATRDLVAAGLVYPKTIRISDYAGLFKNRTNLFLLFQGIAGTIPWGSFFFINKYLNENKGLSIASATNVFLCFGLGMIVGTIAGGQIGGAIFKRDPRKLPIFCALTTFGGTLGIIYVVLLASSNIVTLAAIGFLAAGLAAMTGPNMKTMLLDVNAPEERGAIFSIFNLTDSLGTGLGRSVAGLLSGALGLAMSLAICSTFWVLCTIFLFIVSLFFLSDIEKLRALMSEAASEMKASKPAIKS